MRDKIIFFFIDKIIEKVSPFYADKLRYYFFDMNFVFFRKSKCCKRAILVDTPVHSNLGDHAIVVSMYEFFRREIRDLDIHEFSFDTWKERKNFIVREMNKDDIVFVPGGGFIGTTWMREEDQLIDIISTLRDNPIVIFPQTVVFEDSTEGKREMLRLQSCIKTCKNIHLFARDEMSYMFMAKRLNISNCSLVPDIVTYYVPKINVKRKKEILIVKRHDIESDIDEDIKKFICDSNLFKEYLVRETDTHSKCDYVLPSERKMCVNQKLMEFAQASLVITDRLHGMLFAVITGTPCIAFDNVNRKVSGQYKWLKEIGYVKCVDYSSFDADLIKNMLQYQNCQYDRSIFDSYFEQMVRIIETF